MRRVLLDTGIFIQIERSGSALDELIADDDDVAIAAITATELLEGVENASTKHRAGREAFVEDLLANVPIESYGVEVAREHARLLAHARKAGTPRGAHDLIIAATAITTDREIVTHEEAGFDTLPGVVCRLIPRT